MKTHSILLLSGGLDSAANLALALEEGASSLDALHIQYHQRASQPEKKAAEALCRYYRIPLKIVETPWLGNLGGSSLTDRQLKIPEMTREDLGQSKKTEDSAKSVWVPNRNGVFIQIAAAFAEAQGAQRVLVGFNREEAVTFPDNSEEFLERSTHALALSTRNQVKVFSYTARMNKKEMVQKLRVLSRPFPFDLIWSCYSSGEKPCGICESCMRLERAIEEA